MLVEMLRTSRLFLVDFLVLLLYDRQQLLLLVEKSLLLLLLLLDHLQQHGVVQLAFYITETRNQNESQPALGALMGKLC